MDPTKKQEKLREIFEDEELSLIFEEFLISRYAWENIGFWFDVEEYKSINDPNDRKKFARLIYDKFLDPSSPFELGDVDPEMRELIYSCLNNPPAKLFNILQHRTFLLLSHSNVIPFLADEIYLNYVDSKNAEKRKQIRSQGNGTGYDFIYKLIVVGEFGVGKSSIISRFIRNEFKTSKIQQGVEFETKTLKTQSGCRIKFQIWDTAGQEKHDSLTSLYYRGAAGAVIVYDVSDRNSFNRAEKWLNSVRENASTEISVLLLANKSDRTNERAVQQKEGADFASDNSMIFYECSAETGNNVNQAFQAIIEDIYAASGNNDTLDMKESTTVELGSSENDIYEPNKNHGNGSCKC